MSRYSPPVRKRVENRFLGRQPDRGADARRLADDVPAGDARRTGVGCDQGRKDADRGRLARAVWAQEREYLAGLDHERHSGEGLDPSVGLVQLLTFNALHAMAPLSWSRWRPRSGICAACSRSRRRRAADARPRRSRSVRRPSRSDSRAGRPCPRAPAAARPDQDPTSARTPSRSARIRSRPA